MKLTAERLKELIKEEMEKMAEPEAPEVSQNVQKFRDQMKSGAQIAADRIRDEDEIEELLQGTIDSLTRAKNVSPATMTRVLKKLALKQSNPDKN